ncbi:hypothetical protein [Amycolatopsis solani]|uniref:hypothetical protein n=1 Tax=Amycolatopsis solani TaxID=3028615 RepID=UPI0025B18755|nr:hypothetical protein [Amycolatopsis sp. MEP2-6]
MRPVAERSADLNRLLAQGPFPAALRAAIGESGLSLDRIRHRLARRGLTVSVPTLSLWQSGRRRPERAESLRVLAGLEQLLELPPGALGTLLGPPRPRRHGRLVALSQHDRAEIDESGRLTAVRVRVVLRAVEAGSDRWPVRWDLPPRVTPKIVADRNCRVGSVVHDLDRSRLTADLVLDAAPAPGESVIVEYGATFPARPAAHEFLRVFAHPVRDYLLEARFAELPARCVRLPGGGAVRELCPDSGGTVHVAEADAAGRIGIRWEP